MGLRKGARIQVLLIAEEEAAGGGYDSAAGVDMVEGVFLFSTKGTRSEGGSHKVPLAA